EAVGKAFNLVTPNTSLLVLETAEQYIQHGIVPPPSRKEIYERFVQGIEQRRVKEQQTREERLNAVLAMWDARVKWWEQKHEYAANFAYQPAAATRPAAQDRLALLAAPAIDQDRDGAVLRQGLANPVAESAADRGSGLAPT